MKFVCDKCGAQYKIKDEKIGPNGVSVRCKKCDHRIIVRLPKEESAQQFPSFPTELEMRAVVPKDQEETRQLANPLLAVQKMMEADEAAARQERRRQQKSAADDRSSAEAVSSAAVAAFSKKPEPTADHEPSSVSSLPFDLGLDDEEVGKALDSVLNKPSPEGNSPFDAVGFGLDGAGSGASEPDAGNATRVVNLAEMASLMKAPESKESSASSETTSSAAESDGQPAADAASSGGEEWFVAINGEQKGPMSFEGVKAHWDKGELALDSLVWNAGMSDWAPLSSVPELSKRLEPPKPAMSDVPRPTESDGSGTQAPAGSGALDEWGFETKGADKQTDSSGTLAAAASLPSPQASVDEPAWKPAAASMLSSLIQDEISALSNPPAPAAAPDASAAPLTSAVPQSSTLPLPASQPTAESPLPGTLPVLNALPQPPADGPAPLPSPAADGFLADLPQADLLPPPPAPFQDTGLPMGDAAGFDAPPEPMDSDRTNPGNGFLGDNRNDHWNLPVAAPQPQPARQRQPRSQQGGSRRQGGRRQAQQVPVQQPLPQMPSQTSGIVKGIAIIAGAAVLIVVALLAYKHLNPEQPASTPVAVTQQPTAQPAAIPAAPPAPANVPEANQPAAPSQPAAAAEPAPAPAATEPAKTAPEAPKTPPAPAKAPEAASEDKDAKKRPAADAHSSKKVKKTPTKHTNKADNSRRGGSRLDDDDDDIDEPERPAPAVASRPEPPPPPPPSKPEPASKVDDDFERLFGGGDSSPEPAKPAPKKPSVYVPPPTGGVTKATLSQSDIMGEVMKHRGAIKQCTDDEDDTGTIVMVWSIQQSGKPTGIKTSTADYSGSDLEDCLKGVISKMKFPAYSGAQMQPIKFPFKF